MAGIIVVALAFICGSQEPDYRDSKRPKCDLKKIEEGFWCEKCFKIVEEKDLIGEEDEKKCGMCKTEPKEVELCIKAYYQCPKCFSTAFRRGNCKMDECRKKRTKMVKKLSKCRVIYRCTGSCCQVSETPKKCDSKGCNKRGRRHKKTCEMSGQPPHVDKLPKR